MLDLVYEVMRPGYVDGVPDAVGGESALSPYGADGERRVPHSQGEDFGIPNAICESEYDRKELLW